MALFQAFRHHIKRAAVAATERWSHDCDAEILAEDEALERRLETLEARSRSLETAVRELTAILKDMSNIASGMSDDVTKRRGAQFTAKGDWIAPAALPLNEGRKP